MGFNFSRRQISGRKNSHFIFLAAQKFESDLAKKRLAISFQRVFCKKYLNLGLWPRFSWPSKLLFSKKYLKVFPLRPKKTGNDPKPLFILIWAFSGLICLYPYLLYPLSCYLSYPSLITLFLSSIYLLLSPVLLCKFRLLNFLFFTFYFQTVNIKYKVKRGKINSWPLSLFYGHKYLNTENGDYPFSGFICP